MIKKPNQSSRQTSNIQFRRSRRSKRRTLPWLVLVLGLILLALYVLDLKFNN